VEIDKKRLELISACNKAKEKSDEILNSNSHILIKKMAQQICSRTEKIKELCEVDKYNLFFNGKVAIGKSTAICTIFDLVNKNTLKENSRLSNSLLLKTGSGRTTVCETRIFPNSAKSIIKIEKVPAEEFEIYLTQFCKWLNSSESDISEEELRLIKNMADIPTKLKTPKDILENISEISVENAYDYLLNKINYENRKKLEFPKETNISFEEWIKETFVSINDGKFSECPMPNKIYIYINESDYRLKVPLFIYSIIDTRGLDGGERSDIQKYIALKDSISLMCDEVNAFGGNESILSILKQVLIKEDKDIKYRVALLGLEKGKELENITDCEDDREEGIKTKIAQATKKFNDNSISFIGENFCFCNTAGGFTIQDNFISTINYEKRSYEQETFFNELEKLLLNMYAEYYSELCDALKTLDQLGRGKVTESTLNKFKRSKDIMASAKSKTENEKNQIMKRFRDEIMSIYHSSLYGAVNHNGIGRTADIYASFQKCGGEEFNERCNVHKAEVLVLLEGIFENCTEIENICYRSIVDEINNLYFKFYNEARDNYNKVTYDKLYNNHAWDTPKKYWGDGLGDYKDRVCKDILNEIISREVDKRLDNLKLEIAYFESIIRFLTLT
jgi:hypothetical protein